MNKPARFDWAAATLDIQPADMIFEIGCGVGLAVETIVPKLTFGRIIAIDRSPAAINRATKRNEAAVQEGRAQFFQTDLVHFDHGPHTFDKVLSFNINFFWTKNSLTTEARVLRSLLSKNGLLFIFYGPMLGNGFDKIVQRVTENLRRENFYIADTVYENALKCCCIIAKT